MGHVAVLGTAFYSGPQQAHTTCCHLLAHPLIGTSSSGVGTRTLVLVSTDAFRMSCVTSFQTAIACNIFAD